MIVALLVIGAMAIMLILFVDKAHDDLKESIKVNSDGVTYETLTVKDLKLTPDESREYTVSLTCAASGSYYISLDYEEMKDGGMKSFVDVTVKCGEAEVYNGSLTKLLDEDHIIKFEGELHATEPLVVSICYKMPYSIGNEAQGTYADFKIDMKIEKS